MTGTSVQTGLQQPNGPEITLSPEAKAVLIQHNLDISTVALPLSNWLHQRVQEVKNAFVSGEPTTERTIAGSVSESNVYLELDKEDGGFKVQVLLTFSCSVWVGTDDMLFVRSEMDEFLSRLQPKIHVKDLQYRYHAPTVCYLYLSDPTPPQIAAARQFILSLGNHLESFAEGEPDEHTGSWFASFRLRTKSQITENNAKGKRHAAQEAVKDGITKPSHQNNAEFVAYLLQAIGDNNAIVRLHNFLLVRRQAENGSADILVQTLPEDELANIASSDLLQHPIDLFEKLHGRYPESVLWHEAVLFYSYSHKDAELRDKLESHLSMLKRGKYIRQWYDRKITAGTEWKGQIDDRLSTAEVVLLLVSADFLASDYCYDIEMQRAMERHETKECRVIPVILRACDWADAPFAKLQALPKHGRPVTSWPNVDEAFANVATGIRKAVKELPKSIAKQKLA